MSSTYVKKLGLKIWKNNIRTQKINGSILETFKMVMANFQVEDKGGRPKFFQEIFLVANTKFEMILKILFLKLNNADVSFNKEILMWKSYITNKVLPSTKQVQIIDSQEFVIAVLDADSETFVIHMAIREQEEMPVNSKKQAQVRALLFDKAPSEILAEYSDYSNIISAENIAKLLENTGINEHAIKLEEGKQPFFGPIYSLGPVELKTLEIYIKTNPANSFIWPFKSPAWAPIFFTWKPDGSLRLCVDYWSLNNITIKNRYLLFLISKLLDRLGWAKKEYFWSSSSTHCIASICDYLRSLVLISILSKYTMTKISNFSAKILLTYPWIVAGALDRPKEMT